MPVLIVLFIRHLKRAPDPLLDVKILANKNIKWANWSSMIVLAVSSGAFVLLPFYFQYVKGMSVEDTGFALMVPALAMVFAGPVAGYLADRRGSRPVCASALVIMGLAFLVLSMFNSDTSLAFIVAGLIALGFSLDMFLAPNHALVMTHTPEESQGTSSALMMTMQDTGEVLGVVIFETIFTMFIAFDPTSGSPSDIGSSGLIPGFEVSFLAAAIMCAVAFILALHARDAPRKATPAETEGSVTTRVLP
jgi:MFS family permease